MSGSSPTSHPPNPGPHHVYTALRSGTRTTAPTPATGSVPYSKTATHNPRTIPLLRSDQNAPSTRLQVPTHTPVVLIPPQVKRDKIVTQDIEMTSAARNPDPTQVRFVETHPDRLLASPKAKEAMEAIAPSRRRQQESLDVKKSSPPPPVTNAAEKLLQTAKRSKPFPPESKERVSTRPVGKTAGKSPKTKVEEEQREKRWMAELGLLKKQRKSFKELPRQIRLSMSSKPFDIVKCLQETIVQGLSYAQLLRISPAVRSILSEQLKTITPERKAMFIQQEPRLGKYLSPGQPLEVEVNLVQRDISKYGTHSMLSKVHGHIIRPLLDGGACVNVCTKKFLDRVGIKIMQPLSSIALRGLSGNAKVVGEVHDVPLQIAEIGVTVGCVVIEEAPFEMLLGRGFFEQMNARTGWLDAKYLLRHHGYEITIFGSQPDRHPEVRVIGAGDETESETSASEGEASTHSNTGAENDLEDEESSSESTDSGPSSDEEDLPGSVPAQVYQAELAEEALGQDDTIPLITVEELREAVNNDQIAFMLLLQATPVQAKAESWINCMNDTISPSESPAKSREWNVFSVEEDGPESSPLVNTIENPEAPILVVNKDYGFSLEAPRCRDTLSDTPCIPIPGLEEHSIMVGDLPEVHQHMDQIVALFTKYKNCFPKVGEMSRTMDESKLSMPVTFHVKPNMRLPRARPYKQSPEQIKTLLDYRDKMVAAGKMRKSSSHVSCNPVLIKKKDGTYRVCVNFIPVNAMIDPMAWPINDPMTEIYRLQGSTWMSFWDCKDGYLQSPVAEECRYLTAVCFPDGLYEFNVLPMGFVDAMQWYIRHMTEAFDCPELRERLAKFVDDMGIGSISFEEHLEILELVLQRMDTINGSFSGAKSAFFVQRRTFLGHVISSDTISADPKKLDKVAIWSVPRNVKELRQFIGFALFMSGFASWFQGIIGPLYELYKYDKRASKFIEAWSEDPRYPTAFEGGQKALLSSPVLVMVNHNRPIIVSADTSNYATGFNLAHCADPEDDNNINIHVKYRPIVFGSRKLSDAETRYCATERELLGIIYCLVKYEHLLQGKVIHIFLDHRALLYLHNLRAKNQRLVKWSLILGRFRAKIHHRPGRFMEDTDPLSRIPVLDNSIPLTIGLEDEIDAVEDRDNPRRVLIVTIEEEPYASLAHYLSGGDISEAPSALERSVKNLAPKFYLHKGKLWKRTKGSVDRLYLLPEERIKTLESMHGGSIYSHLGIVGTYRMISIAYFWPGQYQDVKRFIQTCDACQKFQKRESTQYRYHRIPPPPSVFVSVGMDLVGKLTPSNGKAYILNLIDYLSGWAESIPMNEIKGNDIVQATTSRWFCRYGHPQTIITDNGSSLSQGAFAKYCDEHGIRLIRAAPFHPQTNGMVERFNGFMVAQIRRCLAEQNLGEDQWSTAIERVMWTWNTSVKEIRGRSPFEILFGQSPRLFQLAEQEMDEDDWDTLEAANNERVARVHILRRNVHRRVSRSHWVEGKTSRNRVPTAFTINDSVLVYRSQLDKQWSGKFKTRWVGPFSVAAILKGGAYVLASIKDGKISLFNQGRPVNHSRMRRYQNRLGA